WRKARASLSENAATLIVAVAIPMMSKTINTSISEKPCCLTAAGAGRPCTPSSGVLRGAARENAGYEAMPAISLPGPGADVGVTAFAACAPVGTQGKDVDLAMYPRIQILIGCAPGVVG